MEREDEYISRYLQNNKFESVPIREEVETRSPYQYEEDTGATFDTRDYLLEQLAKDYHRGEMIDQKMIQELREKGLI